MCQSLIIRKLKTCYIIVKITVTDIKLMTGICGIYLECWHSGGWGKRITSLRPILTTEWATVQPELHVEVLCHDPKSPLWALGRIGWTSFYMDAGMLLSFSLCMQAQGHQSVTTCYILHILRLCGVNLSVLTLPGIIRKYLWPPHTVFVPSIFIIQEPELQGTDRIWLRLCVFYSDLTISLSQKYVYFQCTEFLLKYWIM